MPIQWHVIEKGSTPAGMHISIMVKEILDFLEIRPGQQGLDCTLGYGGHSRKCWKSWKGRRQARRTRWSDRIGKRQSKAARGRFSGICFQFRLMNFAKYRQRWRRNSDSLILYWRISAFLPCRSSDPKRVFLIKQKVLWMRLDPMHGDSAADRHTQVTQEGIWRNAHWKFRWTVCGRKWKPAYLARLRTGKR